MKNNYVPIIAQKIKKINREMKKMQIYINAIKCNDCEETFDPSDCGVAYDNCGLSGEILRGSKGYEYAVCPYCGGDDLKEVTTKITITKRKATT